MLKQRLLHYRRYIEYSDSRNSLVIFRLLQDYHVIQLLQDIYETLEEDVEEGKKLVIAMAAILVASKDGKADMLWEELSIQEAMKDVDNHIKDILNEG